MITLYRGARGKGKTLTMVKDALKYYKNHYKVYSNLESLKFGIYITSDFILNLSRNSNLNNCVLVIDEIELFFDSRNYSNKQNKAFSNFLQQIRKRNIVILSTCQYISLIDIRIRQQIDVCCYPRFDKYTLYCRAYYFDLTRLEEDYNSKIELSPCLVVYDARDVFGLYNTYELLN
jgi:hypothetical protein